MSGQGSAGNVLAALCSLLVPGLGQLLQARLLMALIQFILAALLWFVLMGWVIHLWSVLDAARWKPVDKPTPVEAQMIQKVRAARVECPPFGEPAVFKE